jgi:hypothetical protein
MSGKLQRRGKELPMKTLKYDREIAETSRSLESARRRYDGNAIASLSAELKRLRDAQSELYGWSSKRPWF